MSGNLFILFYLANIKFLGLKTLNKYNMQKSIGLTNI